MNQEDTALGQLRLFDTSLKYRHDPDVILKVEPSAYDKVFWIHTLLECQLRDLVVSA